MQTSRKLMSTGLIQAALVSTLLVVPMIAKATIANYPAITNSNLLTTDAVYLYVNGVPILQPDAYVQGGGVYEDSVLIGTLNAETGLIYNNNQVIGYVTTAISSSRLIRLPWATSSL